MRKVYTVHPGFIGSIVSRPPKPVKNVKINLRGNDLYVEWEHNDVRQPAITQLIFNQEGGASVKILASNYMKDFKVPYGQFSLFTPGAVNVQISQAFSNTESANSRTSSFSAPSNIFFNAVKHHFVDNKEDNGFNKFPLKIRVGGSLRINSIPK